MKAIIMNVSGDLYVGIIYLSTKVEFDQSTNNGDLLSDKNHRDTQQHSQTDRHTHIHIHERFQSERKLFRFVMAGS